MKYLVLFCCVWVLWCGLSFGQEEFFDKTKWERRDYPFTPPTGAGNARPLYPSQSAHNFSDSVEVAWVSHYAPSILWGDDAATAITVDNSGNIYVTGASQGGIFGFDYFTVKYNADGVEQWSVRYDAGGNDHASAIAVDASGNVYVTGYSSEYNYGSNADYYEYATVKYNSNGVEQWSARYDSPENLGAAATALAVDSAGNIYVTGYSFRSATYVDFVTIKYDSAGIEQWAVNYDGPGNYEDLATALALDNAGNVYVTGRSTGLGSELDYATIKYNASGVEQWVARFHRSTDLPTDLKVDEAGNVYVTGWSIDSSTGLPDFATVKYDSAGAQQWIAYANGVATALAVDGTGNIYVTGSKDGDYATIKYDPAGQEQWIATYNGPGNGVDRANAIAVDDSGNVYVTGEGWGASAPPDDDYATIKYDSMGVQQWEARYDGPVHDYDRAAALAIDSSGNVYVTGKSVGLIRNMVDTYDDYATIKYTASGMEQWVMRYNGPGVTDNRAADLAVDGAGNTYVTGSSADSATHYDYATVKYNSGGTEEWVVRYNGSGNSADWSTALVIDDFGNAYVTGYSWGSGSAEDYATVKYNSSGIEQWTARYNGPANLSDRAMALTVDGAGNVYATGESYGSGTSQDYATVKYNSLGIEQWASRYNGPGNGDDRAIALAVDDSGNVYVTGYSWGSGTSYDYATIRYDSAGVERWVTPYNGPGNGHDRATALALDGAGNICVTGGSFGDYVTIKYDPAGQEQWVARYNSPGNGGDNATALAVDGSGNVYVTGGSDGDYATVKYNAAGQEQWAARNNGLGNGGDEPTALVVDGSGNVYVSGTSDNDYVTVKYASAGQEQWIVRYNGRGSSYDYVTGLGVDGAGNVYVGGSSNGRGGAIYTTIKYIQTPLGIEEPQPVLPITVELAQNYPNPFNPSTTIDFALPQAGYVRLIVYNLLGQVVKELMNGPLAAGRHEVTWNGTSQNGELAASGIYFYALRVSVSSGGEEFALARKMLLAR